MICSLKFKKDVFLKNVAWDFVLLFLVLLHPNCYFTSIMDKTHHGPVIAETSAAFLACVVRGVLGANLFSQFVIERYILAIEQIITHEKHLRYSF